MSLENIAVELTPPTSGKQSGFTAYSGVGAVRRSQVTTGAGTIVIDGITYTRTSPLRTFRDHAGMGPDVDLVAAGDHTFPPVDSRPSEGNALLAIFSASGT